LEQARTEGNRDFKEGAPMAHDRRRASGEHDRESRRGGCRRALQIVLSAIVLWPYSISVSAPGATFTLINRTPFYLHALINNSPSIYIPPGGVITYDAGNLGNVAVDVRYSPGQAKRGSAYRTFEIIYTTTSTGTGSSTATCTEQQNDCQSSTEATTSVSATPVRWEVTQADLTAN
jgi:hypothetical protein